MENNLEEALIAGGLVGLIVIPFLVITQLSKRKKISVAMTAKLTALAHQSNSQLSRSEQIGARAIALDENARKILFIDTDKNKEIMIDLTEITACRLLKKMDINAVGSIVLQLINKNGVLSYTVPFYRRFIDDETCLPAVMKVAEKWRSLILNLVRSQRKPGGVKLFRGLTPQTSFSRPATQ
ncbi:hypothetical protein [Mucilaginibacter ginsenosidivorans]|jgi:hypothetical protein|uniref:Uncharacterized protein n=1 Tax=Mucilaginibacter ginsenosidivorans TaxID=398053 RepID=A0A5B8UV82_9SPHI|nr:hypothetical protein [Mucilaginibacter ginsenosidivorans]QEC62346.1 hypothetical protein FRZ54_07030 [Mucilaginibacter ginsenosidivorans]